MDYQHIKCKYLELLTNMNKNDQIGGAYTKKILFEDGNLSIENNIDNDTLDKNSTFLIGSITKIFTIYVILILHRYNLLNINDNIIKYIKSNNQNNNDLFKNIKIVDVMNHTSGLKNMPNNKKSIYCRHKNIYSCVNTFIDENLFLHSFGTDNYSNIGYIILGYVIEKITNSSYIDACKKYIFIPLNMTNTSIGKTNIKLYSEKCKKIKKYEKKFKYWGLSAGGLYSCVNDLSMFAKKSFNLLDDETLDILLNRIYVGKMNNPRGNIGHSGKIYGAHTRFYFTIENNELKKIFIEFNTCVSIKKEIDDYYKSIH